MKRKKSETADAIATTAEELVQSAAEKVGPLAQAAADKLEAAAGKVGPLAHDTADRLEPLAHNVADKVAPFAQQAADKVSPLAQQAADRVAPYAQQVGDYATQVEGYPGLVVHGPLLALLLLELPRRHCAQRPLVGASFRLQAPVFAGQDVVAVGLPGQDGADVHVRSGGAVAARGTVHLGTGEGG